MLNKKEFKLTVVSPYFNEKEVIATFLEDLRNNLEELSIKYEVILVDDGSSDGTILEIEKFNWESLRVLKLNQNMGHQIALKIGLSYSKGDYVITMDSDLQHPANVIKKMVYEADSSDFEIIQGVRPIRREDSILKRNSAALYYRLIAVLTGINVVRNGADFRLIKSEILDSILKHPSNILRLVIPSLGLKIKYIDFEAGVRVAGKSKYSFMKMLKLAFTSAIDFSTRPLRILSVFGLLISLLAFLSGILLIINYFIGNSVPGWTSLSVLLVFFSGIQLTSISVLGVYFSKVMESRGDNISHLNIKEITSRD
jgi:dolichol-phosphate mannosyltransferase